MKTGILKKALPICAIAVFWLLLQWWSPTLVFAEPGEARKPIDVVLVLDNSGSMIKNDPQFLTREVVVNFMSGFWEDSRIAMVVFDRTARLAVPLMDVTGLVTRARILKGLEQVNYKGGLSDSPSAVERAVYELKNSGRRDAFKAIVLLTDGIVETGDKERDLVKAQWLRDALSQESKNEGIRIFGIAFTDRADFSLIQTLAVKTGGEYFRAYTIDDVQNVFDKINALIKRSPAPQTIAAAAPPPPPLPEKQATEAPPTAVTPEPNMPEPPAAAPASVPADPDAKTILKPTGWGSLQPFLLAGTIVFLAIVVVILFLNLRNRNAGAGKLGRVAGAARREAPMPRAELIDVRNITGRKTLGLENRLTKIGRDSNNEVAIDQETVSSLHATIEYSDGFFYLEDQRSRNKTFLNDEEVAPHSPKKLKSGDVVTINTYKFIFILPDLIPTGETVLDLSGGTHIRTDSTMAGVAARPSKDAFTGPQAMLVDVENVTGKKTVLFDKAVLRIGRGVPNDIVIAQNSISGSHAVIRYTDGDFYLEDLRSKNKTQVNKKELVPHVPMKLKSGDEIMFDVYRFIFLLEQQEPSGDTDEKWEKDPRS